MRGADSKGLMRTAPTAAALALALSLAACATAPPPTGPLHAGGTMAPYQVGGVWYRPRPQPDYDAIGVATWYGAQYHNRRTADGELFDMDRPSAAHTTLPLPCVVEVTNLDNGRKLRLRVNDRGPFVAGRILDVSRQAARELGFYEKGSVRVRVRYVGPAAAKTDTPIAPVPQTQAGPFERRQAGAFADRANAERLAALLGGATSRAVIEPLDRAGGRLWRVMVVGASNPHPSP